MIRRRALLSLLSAAVVFAPAALRAESSGDASAVRRRFAGKYGYAGDERERAARERAIERATAGMPIGIRSIARRRLTSRTVIVSSVELAFPPGKIRVTVPGLGPAVSPDSGEAVDYAAHGEAVRLAQHFAQDKLVQTFASAQGRRVNTYTLDRTGDVLRLAVRVTSPKLPAPLEYRLTYRR